MIEAVATGTRLFLDLSSLLVLQLSRWIENPSKIYALLE